MIETRTNYSEIIKAITLFDNMTSGNLTQNVPKSVLKTCKPILRHLLNFYQRNNNDMIIN